MKTVPRPYQCLRPPILYRDGSPWSDIPVDLAGLVLSRLPAHIDRVRFAAVCPQWRAAAREIPHPTPPLPLLMLPEGTAYSFPCCKPLRFPGCAGYAGACGNWLLYSGDRVCFLWDPFTDATIQLPALSCFQCHLRPGVNKYSGLSSPMDLTVIKLTLCSTSRLVAALVRFGRLGSRIAVCKPRAGSWWSIYMDERVPSFADMAFHQGKLYAVHSDSSDLSAIDISVDKWTGNPYVSGIRGVINSTPNCPPFVIGQGWESMTTMIYLVDSCGALLMVCRGHVKHGTLKRYLFRRFVAAKCNTFEVFKADFERSRWTKVTTVGDNQVLFLSRRQCRSFCVSQFGMPGDRIVFFDSEDEENNDSHGMFTYSCSVYDMREGTASCPLPGVCWRRAPVHATWLFPKELK